MALPNTGGGYQLGDGNLLEVTFFDQPAPQTATATATLTVAQITGGILIGNPSTSAATYTLPTAVALDGLLTNCKVDSAFDLNIINLGTSSGVITLAVGAGITLVGLATTAITSAVGSSSHWRFRKTAAGAWTVNRIS